MRSRQTPLPLRRTPTQERSQQTVDAILEATARVLVQNGYAACSTNRVAKVAGVSIGSLYQYFPDKNSLTLALLDRELARTEAQVLDALRATAASPLEEGLKTLVRTTIQALRPRQALLRIFLLELPGLNSITRFQEGQLHLEPRLEEWLRPRQAELPGRRPELAAMLLATLLGGVVARLLVEQPPWCDDQLLEQELSLLVRAYLTAG